MIRIFIYEELMSSIDFFGTQVEMKFSLHFLSFLLVPHWVLGYNLLGSLIRAMSFQGLLREIANFVAVAG